MIQKIEHNRIITNAEEIILTLDGIVECNVITKEVLCEDDAKEIIEAVKLLSPNKPIPVLVDVNNSKGCNKGCRAYFMSEEAGKAQAAVAIITNSLFAELIGGFFLGLNQPPFPVKLFTDKDKARGMVEKLHLTDSQDYRLIEMVEMISAMSRLDFSKKIDSDLSDDPVDMLAYGLNMLSEEIENKIETQKKLIAQNNDLDAYARTVAHDIQSPINSGIAVIDVIKTELESGNTENLPEYLNLIEVTLYKTKSLIQGILSYSKADLDKESFEWIETRNILSELISEFKTQHDFNVSFSSDFPAVYFNKIAFEQIFSNLISNAIKHNDKEICEIEIEHKAEDNQHKFSVCDNGPGIPKEKRTAVFDLFENLKSAKKDSSGIGLSVVKKIITSCGGNIWVNDSEKGGAEIVFSILQQPK